MRKNTSFSIHTLSIVLVALLLTPFVTNGARAQTTYRVYARSSSNAKMYFYTYESERNGAWGDANIITDYEIIGEEKWYYFDYENNDGKIIFRDENGQRYPGDGNPGISLSDMFRDHRDDNSSAKTENRQVCYVLLKDYYVSYTNEASIKYYDYRTYVMFVGNIQPRTWNKPKMHVWGGNYSTSWPGDEMTESNIEPGWWCFDHSGYYKNIIFSFSASYGSGQTIDINASFNGDEKVKYFVVYTDDKDGGKWKAEEVSGFSHIHNGEFYFVSPELTGGKELPQYRLIPNRHREGGPTSKRFYTLNFKNDLSLCNISTKAKLTEFSWYIRNHDTGECFRPKSDDSSDIWLSEYSPSKNNKTKTSWALCPRQAEGESTRLFRQTVVDERKSFTVFFDEAGEVWMNENKSLDNDDNGFVLIGNFTSAKANVDIRPDLANGKVEYSKKLWWKGGSSSTNSISDPDSIVYYFSVNRPPEGWGQLYLAIAPVSTTFDKSSGWDDAWQTVIRPQIHDIESGFDTDARALSGGLIENKNSVNGTGNGMWLHSLNPEVAEAFTSYEFSMNVTYSTYRLIFKTDLCLIGTAVKAVDDESNTHGGSFEIGSGLIRLQLDEVEGCYKWPYNNGLIHFDSYEEKAMPEFRFVVNGSACNSYQWNFSEDNYAPTSPYYDDPQHGDRPYCANGDTQFRNHLAMHQDGSTSTTDPFSGLASDYGPNDNCRLYLPSGDYVLRFYIRGDEEKTYYYTLDRDLKLRDYSNVTYQGDTRTVEGLGDYKCLTTWSDPLAYQKPDGVDIFVVKSFEPGTTPVATLTNITDDVDCLPAKTGLILASKDDSNIDFGDDPDMPDFKVLTKRLTVYSDPDKTYDGTNKLACAYTAQPLPQTDDNTAYYLFGAYKESLVKEGGSDSNFLLGLWLSDGSRRTYPNSAYLPLSWTDQQSVFTGTDYSFGSSSARSWLRLSLGGYGDDGTTDLMSPVLTPASNDSWYTLQGTKATRPSLQGIYIRNGRKVIYNRGF